MKKIGERDGISLLSKWVVNFLREFALITLTLVRHLAQFYLECCQGILVKKRGLEINRALKRTHMCGANNCWCEFSNNSV